ncbi:nucleoside monophosphate kinase [Candidatus Parcubacteria bacterium]|nr:nucleoside monophosphate kinase [Candidatus Parcubacteria bacterium]
MIISIIGPSGCGKGTQARRLSGKLGVPHISTGQLLRDVYEAGTPDGIAAEKYWGHGEWVSAELMFKILIPRLDKDDCRDGFILDGTPRKMSDIPLFESYLDGRGDRLDKVFHLDTSEATSLARIQKRVELTKRRGGEVRDDETPTAIKERLEEYRETIQPVLDYFEKQGTLERINNERSIGEVFQDIVSHL